ncbi:upstream activation factor subunit spp27 [Quercus suber]|uniref:Upstream activation factor subunit spp27 n=1 Tax=Quercus suber TaxID=58331 RepID=A0AAW0JJ96_QUESU
MVSDSDLIARLHEFLRNSDLTTTSTATVRRKLEEDFGVDLTDKKVFIREQVDLFLQSEQERLAEIEQDGEEDDRTGEVQTQQSDVDDDDDDDQEEVVEETRNGKRKKRSNKLSNEVKKRGGGFTKLCGLSPQLQEFVGASEMARTESTPKEKHQKQEKEEDPDEPKKKEKRQKGGKSGFLAPLQLSDALVKFFGTGESALSRADVVKRMWEYIKQNNLQDPSDKRRIICDGKLKELFDVDSFHGFTVSKLLTVHFIKTEQ